ncbi:hypothetical protein FRC07_001335 [Ceratobasidium sp. 392]|nr:hypothetical protein FRC07_001335 [Ceratobasidium sp. 392]
MTGCRKEKLKTKSPLFKNDRKISILARIMAKDTAKKRKISTDESSVSASGSGSIIEDMGDLKEALSCCNGDDFLRALSNSLDATSPETIRVLKSMLVPFIQASTGLKHCVHCHRSYRESSNTTKSCIVKCVKLKETSYPDKYSDRS